MNGVLLLALLGLVLKLSAAYANDAVETSMPSFGVAKPGEFLPEGGTVGKDVREDGHNLPLCVAFRNKLFVQAKTRGVRYGGKRWIEQSSDQEYAAQYVQSHVADDYSLIQLFDRTRGLRIFFDARDPDSVLAYWCTETPNCVWNVLVTDGELRRGADVDCTREREFDYERHLASTTIKAVEPVLRVPADVDSSYDIALVTAGTPNLERVSDLSADLNARYASTRGYAFYQYHDSMVPRHIVTWNKVKVLLDMFHRTTHEWIMWLDTDAVVTNRSISVGDIISNAEAHPRHTEVDLILCDDIGGWELNTGVMLWRNTPWTTSILEKLWNMEHLPHMQGAEQAQLIKLLRREDPNKFRHHIFDQRVFNAHPSVHTQDMFIIHMMGFAERDRIAYFTTLKDSLDKAEKETVSEKERVEL